MRADVRRPIAVALAALALGTIHPAARSADVRLGDSRPSGMTKPRTYSKPAERPHPAQVDTISRPGPVKRATAGTPVRHVSVTVQVRPLDTAPGQYDRFALMQNEPNPAFGPTTLRFACASASRVTLSLFSIQGQRVAMAVDGFYPAGVHSVRWNATDDRGRPLTPGVYILHMKAGRFQRSRKLVIRP